jgi:hypothetical protein
MRLGVNSNVLMKLNEVDSLEEAMSCLIKHGIYSGYDAGVERRMLLVKHSKLETTHFIGERSWVSLINLNYPCNAQSLVS